MNITEEILKELLWTDTHLGRDTLLIQGRPRSGKTALSGRLAEAVVGPDETFIIDWPEEEGTRTLKDRHIPFACLGSQADIELWYPRLLKIKPKAIIWDGLAASYWVFMRERVPSGIPPEDHGKTWNAVAIALRREIVRFKLIPSVEVFIVTSLVWGDQDDLATSQEKRLQVTIPGQLKANIYGLFSSNLLIEVEDQPNGSSIRVLKAKPTARFIAGIRAPIDNSIPARIPYDLAKPDEAKMIAIKLDLQIYGEKDETNSGSESESHRNGREDTGLDVGTDGERRETGNLERKPKRPLRRILGA